MNRKDDNADNTIPLGEDDMQIRGLSHVHQAQSLGAPHTAQPVDASRAASPASGPDQLEISETAQLVDRVHELPEIRQELVAEIRQAIASGEYETPERLDGALSQLLDEIA